MFRPFVKFSEWRGINSIELEEEGKIELNEGAPL